MKKIAIISIDYNRDAMTHDFLESVNGLRHTKDFLITTIIVDNASKDVFSLTKEEKARGNVVVLRNDVNTGFTGGNNTGMRYALENGFDYIVVLNNDTMLDPDLLKTLFEEAEKDSSIGLLVPKIYFAPGHEFHEQRYKKNELGKVFWYAGGFVDWANVMSVHRGVDEVDHRQYDTQEEVGFATGCCMFIRRAVLEQVGLFDQRYFLYCEDADLNERIKHAGYKVMYVPQAFLWHISAGSTGGTGSVLQDYFLSRNRMLFGMKYAPLRSKIALVRESLRLLRSGREWQKKGIRDFYLRKFEKGSFGL